jgi:hypothetical protein
MKLNETTVQGGPSIMRQGIQSLTTTQCYNNELYTYDENQLVSKWGAR